MNDTDPRITARDAVQQMSDEDIRNALAGEARDGLALGSIAEGYGHHEHEEVRTFKRVFTAQARTKLGEHLPIRKA